MRGKRKGRTLGNSPCRLEEVSAGNLLLVGLRFPYLQSMTEIAESMNMVKIALY